MKLKPASTQASSRRNDSGLVGGPAEDVAAEAERRDLAGRSGRAGAARIRDSSRNCCRSGAGLQAPRRDADQEDRSTRQERQRCLECLAMATKAGSYGEASINVLKGLEPVKQRPGMYTRTDNPLHIIRRWWTTRPTRRWPARAQRSTCGCTATARSASTTTAAASRSAFIPKKASRRRDGLYPAACGRQVRQESRRRLQFLRRPARRRRLRHQCARQAPRSDRVARRPAAAHRLCRRRRGDAAGGDEGRAPATARAARRSGCGRMPQLLRQRRDAARRTGAPAAQQGGADARREGHADGREDRQGQGRTQDWLYQAGLSRLPDAGAAGRPADPAVRGRALRRRQARARTSPKARARPGASP